MPYRAWDLLDLIGKEQAHTLLRDRSVTVFERNRGLAASNRANLPPFYRSCSKPISSWNEPRALEQLRTPGLASWSEANVKAAIPEEAAEAAATALAQAFTRRSRRSDLPRRQSIDLRDRGRAPGEESPGKPPGSVHGDSVGHACDSACAWRNLARVSNARNTNACLILGAYQVALDRVARGRLPALGAIANAVPFKPAHRHRPGIPSSSGRRGHSPKPSSSRRGGCDAIRRSGISRAACLRFVVAVHCQRGRISSCRKVLPHCRGGVCRHTLKIPMAAVD